MQLKKIKQIIKNNPEVYMALEDFEKTGKVITKIRMNFTIDKITSKKFRKYCDDNGYNMSALIEGFMKNKIRS